MLLESSEFFTNSSDKKGKLQIQTRQFYLPVVITNSSFTSSGIIYFNYDGVEQRISRRVNFLIDSNAMSSDEFHAYVVSFLSRSRSIAVFFENFCMKGHLG